ncbi:MAG: type VII secretion integral membrane protein EccD [Pseudonocardia sp.]|nr:type VII secretion integral membrane protein EccD [Pseudonocardia sp.]
MTSGTGFCRVTLAAPQGRVDVALPADVPVAELVPMVLELLGEPRGSGLLPWRISGAAGGVLPAAATLDGLGVLDGELLRIGPAHPAPAAPVFDDPVDAVAAAVADGARVGHAGRWAVPGAAVLVTAVAAALSATVRGTGGPALAAAVVAALGSAAAVAIAARTARPPIPDRGDPAGHGPPRLRGPDDVPALPPAAVAAAMGAIVLAAAAGWLVPPGPTVAAVLTSAAAAGVAATAGQAVLRIVTPPLVAAILMALAVALGAGIAFLLDVPPVALVVGTGTVALGVGPLLPRLALRLAGVPARGDLAGDAPFAAGPADGPGSSDARGRADLARGYLAGIVGADAILVGVGAAAAATVPGVLGPALAMLSIAVLLLRSRAFAERLPARSMQVSALLAAGAAGLSAGGGSPGGRVLVAAGLLVALLAGAAAAGAGSGTTVSPVLRRAADLAELVLTAAAVPLAFAVTGLFGAVRGW